MKEKKIAHWTGDAWLLQYENEAGDYYPEEGIDWPQGWPERVDADFLEKNGFEVVF